MGKIEDSQKGLMNFLNYLLLNPEVDLLGAGLIAIDNENNLLEQLRKVILCV